MQAARFLDFSIRRRRKLLILLAVAVISVFYVIPFVYRSLFAYKPNFHDDSTGECIEHFLRAYQQEILASDASVWIPSADRHITAAPTSSFSVQSSEYDEKSQNTYFPVVGNGKFVISPVAESEFDRRFHIRGKRTLDIAVPFDPVVTIDSFGTQAKTAIITRYRAGSIEKCTCVNYAGNQVSVQETFTAHRLIPSLFTQSVRISNPSSAPIIVQLRRRGWLNKLSKDDKVEKMLVTTSDNREYSMHVGRVYDRLTAAQSSNNNYKKKPKEQTLAIAYPTLHETIEVHPRSQGDFLVQTFMNYTPIYEHETEMQKVVPDLKVKLKETARKVVQLSPGTLQTQNAAAWEWLWLTGYGISHSHAPNAINAHQINATLFYLMIQRPVGVPSDFGPNAVVRPIPELASFTDQPLDQYDMKSDEHKKHTASMSATHSVGCYNGHSTLHASKLWEDYGSLSAVQTIASRWFLTLEKQSCENLIKTNAHGVQQAFVFSLLGLRFSGKHIEFRSNPVDLQRDFHARQLRYDNDGTFNLSVIITEENKAVIQVSMTSFNDRNFYGCDAGCLDAPVRLHESTELFPVKLTDPLTSLLYITPDREHITELKHSIHVKEINEAPAHEHHTLAMHKYGHSLGGLPTIFWIVILFLIVAFHFFLGKLIYNEYMSSDNKYRYEKLNSGRYSM